MTSRNRTPARVGLLLALVALAPDGGGDLTVGRTYRVPYRLTDTNHALVRVRVDGVGPFNFLVDTGAPALYVGTAAARKIGLEPSRTDYWTVVDRLEFEGGPTLTKVQGRVEDPFQLVAMNALGLPGATIDGILGYSALARFRIVIDPTTDRMTWTRLDHDPKMPAFSPRKPGEGLPPEVAAMDLMGPMAKFAALMIGKQPEEQLHPRGWLGLELAATQGAKGVRVVGVVDDSPVAEGGLKAGDQLVRLLNREVDGVEAAHRAVAEIKPGDRVAVRVRRGDDDLDLTLTAVEGL